MFLSTCRVLLRCQKYSLNSIVEAIPTLPNAAQNMAIMYRPLCIDPNAKDIAKTAVKKERAKTVETPKITLLDTNDKIICVTTEVEATKIATGKNLKLVKIVDEDTRTVRPIFKLMSETQFIEEDLKLRSKNKEEKKKSNSYIKGEKMLIITSKISTYDFNMKLSKLLKWLEKKFEVHVLISGSPDAQTMQEEMYKKLEIALKGKSRIVQKIHKSGNLKFSALPLREEEDKTHDESTKEKSDNKKSEAV